MIPEIFLDLDHSLIQSDIKLINWILSIHKIQLIKINSSLRWQQTPIKTVVGGAVAGSVVPGLGTLAGAGLGLIGATVDAGLSMINLAYQEKGLRLKPDQSFGESSEVSLQMINIFGIYWVKRTPENIDLMLTEYALRGFPTSVITSIDDLEYTLNAFGDSKIVYGELKTVIKSEYVTSYINQKLKEGIVIFA